MALPNPFRRWNENTRECWGYVFDLSDDHLTPENSRPLRYSYDILGEECLDRLNAISPPKSRGPPQTKGPDGESGDNAEESSEKRPPERDLYVLLRDNHASDPKLSTLWTELTTIPPWVDWDQIARGQDVFYRYGGAALTGLAYQSLLGGMGAARVVETLARTGGFGIRVARRRMFETMQHILQCTAGVESLRVDGAGFVSSVKVRLLHAAVRKRIMALARAREGYYDIEAWGVPVNDLDCIATIATFSATLIFLSWPRQGIILRRQETEDYVALWRYIAYLVGCPTEYFETPEKARAAMESLLYYEIKPTKTSAILANNIIRGLQDQPPAYPSADMLIASARWLNGNKLCDALELPRPGLYYWALMAGQCVFFMFMFYGHRCIPYLDRKKVAFVRRTMWKLVIESKAGLSGQQTNFEFKYVPEYSTITDMGNVKPLKGQVSSVERRNLKALLLGLCAVGAMSWGTYKAVSGIGSLCFRLFSYGVGLICT